MRGPAARLTSSIIVCLTMILLFECRTLNEKHRHPMTDNIIHVDFGKREPEFFDPSRPVIEVNFTFQLPVWLDRIVARIMRRYGTTTEIVT
jgi:hypothetical protein